MADSITVKVEGINELQAKFKELDNGAQKILSQAVSAGAAVVERDAKMRVHVITGNLRRSIKELQKIESSGKIESQVGSDIEYAAIEEFRPGHQYLRPALDENEAAIQAAFEAKIKQLLGRYK